MQAEWESNYDHSLHLLAKKGGKLPDRQPLCLCALRLVVLPLDPQVHCVNCDIPFIHGQLASHVARESSTRLPQIHRAGGSGEHSGAGTKVRGGLHLISLVS